ncbi:hypothetical protein [Sphingomonas piscis]|uniref:hypothetical protein n=1 Tax=Sphingomonas piscis TaxID=2714943 RepID=UPI0019D30B5B|nr:hypothetical protein [Sphingomonas piscis]
MYGVGQDGRFIYVRHSLVVSPQFSALSPNARNLFWELQSMFNGRNSDTLFLSVRDAADRLGLVCLKATGAAFDELVNLGFLREAMAASFRQKYDSKSRARAWKLLWIGKDNKCSGPDFLPPLDGLPLTKKERKREAARSTAIKRFRRDGDKGKFTVEDSSTLAARAEFSVEDSSTVEMPIGGKLPTLVVGESSTHICYQGGVGNDNASPAPHSAWWASIERCMARRSDLQAAA